LEEDRALDGEGVKPGYGKAGIMLNVELKAKTMKL